MPTIPDRVFTAYSMPTAYRNSYIRADNPPVGFIFVNRHTIDRDYFANEQCTKDLDAILTDPLIKQLMGPFYVGSLCKWTPSAAGHYWQSKPQPMYHREGLHHGIIVSQQLMFLPDCNQPLKLPLHVALDHMLHRYTLDDVYQSCRDLRRLIGCDRCTDAGTTCMMQNLQVPLAQPPLPTLGSDYLDMRSDSFVERMQAHQLYWDEVQETLQPWKDVIAGYTYVSPTLTNYNALQPGATITEPVSLDFGDLDAVHQSFKERTQAGVKTRRTKRVECSKCYCGGTGYKNTPIPCSQWNPRYCEHGAWTKEQLIDATIPPYVQRLSEIGFSLADFYGILAIAGKPFRRPTENGGHAKWIVRKIADANRYTHSPSGIQLLRTARGYRSVSELVSLKELWQIIPEDLRRTFTEAPTLTPELTAVAMQVSTCNSIRPYICVAGCIREVTPTISHVTTCGPHIIEVGYWVTTYWRTMRFNDLVSVLNYFEGMLAFRITKKTEDLGFEFNVWPR